MPTDAEITRYAEQVADMIADDIAEGIVPEDVADWAALHDHVDANEYTLSLIEWTGTDDNIALHVRIENEAWSLFTQRRREGKTLFTQRRKEGKL